MFLTGGDEHILSAVREQFRDPPPGRIGVAVSGGGDSVALMHILHHLFGGTGVDLKVVSIDHGLRREAQDEIRIARDLAGQLGLTHDTLTWDGWSGEGNLQDAARQARYALLADWARKHGVSVIAIGHTADDQAETVLMRLARSSGLNGLSGMSVRRVRHGVTILRPLLGITRADLRAYLGRAGVGWADDPSNDDTRFERVRARQAMQVLDPLGITAQGLSRVAHNLGQARQALDWYCFLAARDAAHVDGGDVVISQRQFRVLPEEIARRLLIRAIAWITGAPYPPRGTAVNDALEICRAGRSTTLHGCRILGVDGRIWICREYNAVRGLRGPVSQPWDRRWQVTGDDPDNGCELRPLGRRGLMLCDAWRETGRPMPALTASPSVWSDDDLVAAPLAGAPNGWHAELVGGDDEFFASILSH